MKMPLININNLHIALLPIKISLVSRKAIIWTVVLVIMSFLGFCSHIDVEDFRDFVDNDPNGILKKVASTPDSNKLKLSASSEKRDNVVAKPFTEGWVSLDESDDLLYQSYKFKHVNEKYFFEEGDLLKTIYQGKIPVHRRQMHNGKEADIIGHLNFGTVVKIKRIVDCYDSQGERQKWFYVVNPK